MPYLIQIFAPRLVKYLHMDTRKVFHRFPKSKSYQALRKATGAVQGTAMDKVNRMAGVEDVPTYLDNCQARFVARCAISCQWGLDIRRR